MVDQTTYALLSTSVYNSSNLNEVSVNGWTLLPNPVDNGLTGVYAAAFRNDATGEIVISIRGTNTTISEGTIQDWSTNISVGLGVADAQIAQVMQFYLHIKAQYGENNGENISFTGHSLGGGIASLMAVFFNRTAVVFDEAPFQLTAVNPLTVQRYAALVPAAQFDPEFLAYSENIYSPWLLFNAREENVTHHYLEGEILAFFRALPGVPYIVGDGAENKYPTAGTAATSFALHDIRVLAAAQYSHEFLNAIQKLPNLVTLLLDTNLYAADRSSTVKRDFLSILLRRQFGNDGLITADGMLDGFSRDLNQLTPGGLIKEAPGLEDALIVALMQGYDKLAEDNLPFTTDFFQGVPGGFYFDANRIAANFGGIRTATDLTIAIQSYHQLDSSISVYGFDRWYLQAGTTSLIAQSTGDTYDLISGGSGVDLLSGGPGFDLLLGGAGMDIYYYRPGDGHDTIFDSDGKGIIIYDPDSQALGLVVGVREAQSDGSYTGPWQGLESSGETITYTWSGTPGEDLIISIQGQGTITIKTYRPGDYGIQLIDLPDYPDGPGSLAGTSSDDFMLGDDDGDNLTAFGGNDYLHGGMGGDYLNGGIGRDVVIGGPGIARDYLIGGPDDETDTADAMQGGGGDDYIHGGGGDDFLAGGSGKDILIGGLGNDFLFGAATLTARPGNEWSVLGWPEPSPTGAYEFINFDGQPVYSGEGDIFDGGAGADLVVGTNGADIIIGGNENANTSTFVDSLNGFGGNDLIFGGTGADGLFGGAGADLLFGGSGNDFLYGDELTLPLLGDDDILDGGAGDDELYGHGGNDTLFGGKDNDKLYGGYGDDFLYGGDGDDTLYGGFSRDVLQGGKGTDYIWRNGKDHIVYNRGDGFDYVYLIPDGSDTDPVDPSFGFDVSIRSVSANDINFSGFIGSSGRQWLFIDVEGGDGVAIQNGFVDVGQVYDIGGRRFTHAELLAFANKFTVTGTEADDTIAGFDGDDTLLGYGGDDSISGGAGNDSLNGGTGADFLVGGPGNDNYIWNPGDGSDVIIDDSGVDRITFGGNIDLASLDVRIYISDDGSGYLRIDHAATGGSLMIQNGERGVVDEYAFADGTVLNFGQFASQFGIALNAIGTPGDDTLFGGDGPDDLRGLAGDDILIGNGGDDQLDGGTGNDLLEGGPGDDTYILRWGMGQDTIIDGDGLSTLALADGIEFSDLAAEVRGNDLWVYFRHTTDGALIKDYLGTESQWQLRTFAGAAQDMPTLVAASQPQGIATVEEAKALYEAQFRAQFFSDFGAQGYTQTGPESVQRTFFLSGPTFFTKYITNWSYQTVVQASDAAAISRLSPASTGTSTTTVHGNSSVPIYSVSAGSDALSLNSGGGTFYPNSAESSNQQGSGTNLVQIQYQSVFPGIWILEDNQTVSGGLQVGTATIERSTTQFDGVITLEEIRAGASNNSITFNGNVIVDGGAGNDTIGQIDPFGRPPRGTGLLHGGAGDDTIYGGDTLIGGAGADFLDGGEGADRYLILQGQPGTDLIFDSQYLPYDSILGDTSYYFFHWYYGSIGLTDWVSRFWDGRFNSPNVEPLPQSIRPPANDYVSLRDLLNASSDSYSPSSEARFIPQDTVEFGAGISVSDLTFSWGSHVTNQPPSPAYGPNSGVASVTTLDIAISPDQTVRIAMPWSGMFLYDLHEAFGFGVMRNDGVNEWFVDDIFYTGGAGFGVEQFQFADGTILSMEQILALAPPPPTFDPLGVDDVQVGTPFADDLYGGDGNDQLSGFDGDDFLTGGNGNDTLFGGAGNDNLAGGAGNDSLIGGANNDLLVGGAGDDVYQLDLGDGIDVILDRELGSERNRIVFGSGITAQSLQLEFVPPFDPSVQSLVEINDQGRSELEIRSAMRLSYGNQGDAVYLFGFDRRTGVDYPAVGEFVFADGSTLTWEQLVAGEIPPGGNTAPILNTPILDQNTPEDEPFAFTVPPGTFTDSDSGDVLTYAATMADGSPLSPRLNFDPTTQGFSGTPSNADVGSLDIRVTATDSQGASVSDVFTLTVTNTNDAPTLAAAILDQMVDEDSVFSFTVPAGTFADDDAIHGDTLNYTASLSDGSALPGWLAFDAATRTFSGTPTNSDVGSIDVRVTATDGAGASVSDTFSLMVANTNDAPIVMSPIADQAATEGAGFNFTFPADTFTDPDVGDTLTYSVTLSDGSPLPSWLSFDAVTRTFSGTPANADIGSLTVRVAATDTAGATANDEFSLAVLAGGGETIIGGSWGDTLVGTAGPDYIDGGDGPDEIYGGGGNDTIIGGLSDDWLYGEGGDDTFIIEGDDAANDVVNGGLGFDRILGGTGDDVFRFRHFTGDDTVELIDGGAGANIIVGDQWATTLDFRNTILHNIAWIDGGDGSDIVYGSQGDDDLRGGAEHDDLYGEGGNDRLHGGVGDDWLIGGTGDDTYVYNQGDGNDTIFENDATAGNTDTVQFNINPLNLIFSQSGSHLQVKYAGTPGTVTIDNWYTGSQHQTEVFSAANGSTLLNTQVANLIQAMAQFSANNGGITWDQAIDQRPQDVQQVIAAYWQPAA